jgi:hypothetical protein
MVDAGLIVGFWQTVEDCLVAFHHVPREAACGEVRALLARRRFDQTGPESSMDMIYHEEPFYIACNLVESDLKLDAVWPTYRTIVAKNGLSGATPVPIAETF